MMENCIIEFETPQGDTLEMSVDFSREVNIFEAALAIHTHLAEQGLPINSVTSIRKDGGKKWK